MTLSNVINFINENRDGLRLIIFIARDFEKPSEPYYGDSRQNLCCT